MTVPFIPVLETWRGQYFYGRGYSNAVRARAVAFTVEWLLDDGLLRGTCVDEETTGLFAAPATIRGFIHEGFISFVKQYPCQWTLDAAGRQHLYPRLPGPEIHYSGSLNDGQWDITTDLRAKPQLVEQAVVSGSWFLHRVA